MAKQKYEPSIKIYDHRRNIFHDITLDTKSEKGEIDILQYISEISFPRNTSTVPLEYKLEIVLRGEMTGVTKTITVMPNPMEDDDLDYVFVTTPDGGQFKLDHGKLIYSVLCYIHPKSDNVTVEITGDTLVVNGKEFHGIPAGGDAGFFLAKNSAGNYDVHYVNPPTGGGSVNVEINGDTIVINGRTINEVPTGGTIGQVLTKKTNANNDVEWANAAGSVISGKHNDMKELQGGVPTERYHLDAASAYKVTNIAPDKPYNVSPYNQETDVTNRLYFQASKYHNMYGYDMYGYQLQIMNNSNTVIYDTGTVEASEGQHLLAAGILSVNSDYTWHIRYQGTNLVWSLWSNATMFSTESTWSSPLLLQPRVIVPGNGGVVANSRPQIMTTIFDDGSGLTQVDGDYIIASDQGFTNIIEQGTGKLIYTPNIDLTRGRQYFVRANHKGKDSNNTIITSRYSPRISFIIKGLYRNTRIGLVLSDESTFTMTRIGENWLAVDLDSDYWLNHPIYMMLEATKNQQLYGGNGLTSLLKFWIYSDEVPEGPYAGKKCWIIDSEAPTQTELDNGWHIHNAFISPQFGTQDQLLMGRAWAQIPVNGVISNDSRMLGDKTSIPTWKNHCNTLNSDESDPAKSGWHTMFYYEYEALKLLATIKEIQILHAHNKFNIQKTMFYNTYMLLQENSSSNDMGVLDGMYYSAAVGPASPNITYPITPRYYAGATNMSPATDLYRNSDGPVDLHLGDYMISLNRSNGPGILPDGSKLVTNNYGGMFSCVKSNWGYDNIGWTLGYPNGGVDAGTSISMKVAKYS